MPHDIRDRTQEFHAKCERMRDRNPQSARERRALITSPIGSPSSSRSARSEFNRHAADIARGIGHTQNKLEELTQLVKQTSLLDDKTVQINGLTEDVKGMIAGLNNQIATLQHHVKSQAQSSKQASEHATNTALDLQKKLTNASKGFKDILEIRTENMAATKEKQKQYLISAREQSNWDEGSPLMNPRKGRRPNGASGSTHFTPNETYLQEEESTLSLGIPMITPQQQQQQQLLLEEQDHYIESRSTAIQSIESTIAELGGIFQQLATMVAEQREQVQRIDQNTEDIEMNVMGAQRELLKYYASISSNRWLIFKVFTTVFLFFLLFTFIM